jgi:ABC-type antimicrobial peptide transport system permease subunit
LIIVTVISTASKLQIDHLKESVGNAVIVQMKSDISDEKKAFYSADIEILTNHSFVMDYNLISLNPGVLADAVPAIRDPEFYQRLLNSAQEDGRPAPDNCYFVGVTNSSRHTLYSSGGYKLVGGRHLTADDSDKNVTVISKDLAIVNNLGIGDSIAIKPSYLVNNDITLELKIVGLYECTNTRDKRASMEIIDPENYIFIPESTLSRFSYYYAPLQLVVYLLDGAQAEQYVKDMTDILGEEYSNPLYGTFRYIYTWDKEWYQTVSKPVQEISQMSVAIFIIVAVGVYVVILLMSALILNRKKREIGIILSMGETKTNLIVQILVEHLTPILLALFIAGTAAAFTAGNISSMLMTNPAEETNVQIANQRKSEIRRNMGFYLLENEIKSLRTSYFYIDDRLNIRDSLISYFISRIQIAF